MVKKFVLLTALAIAAIRPDAGHAEVVFSNLNTSSSASAGSGFTEYAQRFTTISSGTGFQVGLNLLSLSGTQNYTIQLWGADGTGNNVSSLLQTIASGSVTSSDKTAVSSFSSSYALGAATSYFIKIVASSGSFAIALGPNSSTALNSIARYGVGNLNNSTTGFALGMEVAVVTAPIPEPGTWAAMVLLAGGGALRLARQRRRK